MLKRDLVQLPTTEQEFLDLCDRITKLYPTLDSMQKVAASLHMAISFLPKETAHASFKTLANTVLKANATHLAKYMAEKIGHQATVDFLLEDAKLTGSQQSIDQLTQAAAAGSEYAKKALADLNQPLIKDSIAGIPNTGVATPDAKTT